MRKSKKPHRRHAPACKTEVVDVVRNGDKTSGAVPEGPTLSASEKEELAHLGREVKTLRSGA